MRALIALLLSLLIAAPALAQPSAAFDIAGVWWTQGRRAKIEIAPCGASPCGRIVWVDPAEAGSGLDERNRDPALRTRAIIGLQTLWGFTREGERWRNGRAYDPESGGTYTSHLQLQPDGTLRVQGCAGPFCRTQIWERAP